MGYYVVSLTGTPFLRFTVPYGIPVAVSNAGKSLLAYKNLKYIYLAPKYLVTIVMSHPMLFTTSSAILKRGPLQGHPGSRSTPALRILRKQIYDKR